MRKEDCPMIFELVMNIYIVVVNIVALVYCVFRFIAQPRRGWAISAGSLISSFLSNYYWATYMFLMRDYPRVSSFLAYLGWNVSFALMLWLTVHFRNGGKRVGFHPLKLISLVPIPLNFVQFLRYLPLQSDPISMFTTVWQNVLCTVTACIAVLIIVNAFLKKKKGEKTTPPYVPAAVLVFIALEYAMWTTSGFEWLLNWFNPNFYISLVFIVAYPPAFIWAIKKTYDSQGIPVLNTIPKRTQKMLQTAFAVIVCICCLGGVFIGRWMRDIIISRTAEMDPGLYRLISSIIFITAFVVDVFALMIMLFVRLGQKVAESDELRVAKDAAEHTSAAKSDFLANMSHEIRTPINAVLGMNEMILRESVHASENPSMTQEQIRDVLDKIAKYSENIESAESNLLLMVNDILDFSKIETGKLDLIPGRYSLTSVLDEVCKMIAHKAKSKGLAFGIDVDGDLPDCLFGDEVRVRQIMTNILNNAVKFTDEGSVSLTVRCEDGCEITEGSEANILISVSDTGIGIKQEDLSKLFSEFERIDLTRNSTVEGAGIGLAITKKLLDMMEGEISVESVYGSGSVFNMKLPQKVASAERIGDYRMKFENSTSYVNSHKDAFRAPGASVLVVDDTKMNITVVSGLLRYTGIRIDVAGSGEEAVAKCSATGYDLILMDHRMPVMDGTEALHRIRETSGGLNGNTPVICLTANAVAGARERFLSEGFTDYLTKPVDAYSLEQTLLRYLPEKKIVRTASVTAEQKPLDDSFESLRDAGIDPGEGMGYCQSDPVFYRSVLSEFAWNARSQMNAIRDAYEDHDWKKYAILVHALKSTSKTIGADLLSSLAADLEARADEEDENAVISGHETLETACFAVADAIKKVVPRGEGADGEEPDILEFDPE